MKWFEIVPGKHRKRDVTTVFAYSHLSTPIDQWECPYCLKYFINYIALHCITLHRIALHCITFHYIVLHCITLHCIALICIALHCITWHYIALHYIALRCIALHYITLHYVTLHYITLPACSRLSSTSNKQFAAVCKRTPSFCWKSLRWGTEETADVLISSNFTKCKEKISNSNFLCLDFTLGLVSKLEETSFKVSLQFPRGFRVWPFLLRPKYQKKENKKVWMLHCRLVSFVNLNTIQLLTKTSASWVQ